MPPSTHSRLHGLLTSHAAVFLLYALLTLPFLLLQDLTILHSDDWFIFENLVRDRVPMFTLYHSRLLYSAFWRTAYALFATNPAGVYALLWLVQVSFAYSVYRATSISWTESRVLAITAGLIVLFSPGDHSREWWTMGSPWVGTWLFLGPCIILLARYMQSMRPQFIIAAGILLALSFGSYESHLGIAALMSLFIFRVMSPRLQEHRWSMFVFPLIIVVYVVIHYIQGHQLSVANNYILTVSLDPGLIFARTMKGVVLLLKSIGSPWYTRLPVSTSTATLLTLAMIAATGVISAVVFRRITIPHQPHVIRVSARPTSADVKYFRLCIALALATLAGLFPVILNMPPSGNDIDARTLMSCIPSFMLFIGASALFMLGPFIDRKKAGRAILVTLIPLLMVGLLDRYDRLQEHLRAWNLQKAMWHSMIAQTAKYSDSTFVIILNTNEQRQRTPAYRPLFAAPIGDLKGGLRLLFAQPSLSGAIISTGWADERRLTDQTASSNPHPLIQWPIPWTRLVVWRFDEQTRRLMLLSRPELEKRWGLALPAYNPYTRIDTNGVNTSPWRSLIE